MGRPLRISYPGAYYHITARGNEQKDIFKSKRDREQFLTYLESSVSRYGAVIHAYCLMSNHYHLLLETPDGNIPDIMRHINGAYTNFFNTKRKRAGHLFQGRYNAILIDADEYLMELFLYIHLNPVRAHMVDRPEEHPWSSYPDYIGVRAVPAWLTTGNISERIGGSAKYRRFVEDLLDKDYVSPFGATVASTLLGSELFIQEVMATHIDMRPIGRDVPAIRELLKLRRIERIAEHVQTAFDEPRLARKVGIYLTHLYSGARLKELGSYFGKKESAVSQTTRRLAAAMAEDEDLRNAIMGIEVRLKLS